MLLDRATFAAQAEADLELQLANLKAGRAKAFVYLNSGFDWEPLFRFTHLCGIFVYVDPRFSREQFNTAFNLIRAGQTKVGAGLESLPAGDTDYGKTLDREILPAAVQENLDWLGAGTDPVKSWVRAKLLSRKIGQHQRRLWLIYIGGSPLAAYKGLFADRQLAPRCLCLRQHMDVDAPEGATADDAQRQTAWAKAVLWDGPLGQMIRDQCAPLPEFLVGDGHELDWPHEIRQFDSDLRLQPFCGDLRGKWRENGRVSVKVSVARLLRYNSKRTRPLLANGVRSSWFIVII
jgi:hypothetical protein